MTQNLLIMGLQYRQLNKDSVMCLVPRLIANKHA